MRQLLNQLIFQDKHKFLTRKTVQSFFFIFKQLTRNDYFKE